MIKFIKSFFKKTTPTDVQPEVPYKVETPAPVVDVAPVPAGTPLVNDAGTVVAIADGNPAPGPKVAPAKKPRAPKAEKAPAVKKPRAPRKPKAK